MQSELLGKIRQRLGQTSESGPQAVEAGHVRRFCEAVGDDDPRWLKEAPPTFVVSFHSEIPAVPEAMGFGKGWLNGGDRFEYLEPVKVGDQIRVRTTFVDAYEKEGSSGVMLFLVYDTDYVNQEGRVAVRSRGTRIRR